MMRIGVLNSPLLLLKRIIIPSFSNKEVLTMYHLVSNQSIYHTWKELKKVVFFCKTLLLLLFLAGTVIDSKVCHPLYYDFYMCAHAGMIVSTNFFESSSYEVLCFMAHFIGLIKFAGHKQTNSLPCVTRRDRLFTRWSARVGSPFLLCVRTKNPFNF